MKYFATIVIALLIASFSLEAQDNQINGGGPRYEISVVEIDAASGAKQDLGKIVIELFPDVAPQHVRNFDSLVAVKFYDGTAFHRVIPGFMIQGGDPNSKDKPKDTWGMGAPGQTRVPAEFSSVKHVRGIVSAARSNDINSATSQFFIMHGNSPHLDGKYSAFGQTVSGLEIVDLIANKPRDKRDNPNNKIEMTIKKLSK